MNTLLPGIASLAAALLVVAPGPAASQEDVLPEGIEDLTSSDAIADAASELADVGEDRLLLTNMLGQEIKGSDGGTIGTVKDFVVIPGGRLIAAIVEIDDDTRVAIPFGAVKVAGSADDLGLEVPVEASEIRDMDELQELAATIGDG